MKTISAVFFLVSIYLLTSIVNVSNGTCGKDASVCEKSADCCSPLGCVIEYNIVTYPTKGKCQKCVKPGKVCKETAECCDTGNYLCYKVNKQAKEDTCNPCVPKAQKAEESKHCCKFGDYRLKNGYCAYDVS